VPRPPPYRLELVELVVVVVEFVVDGRPQNAEPSTIYLEPNAFIFDLEIYGDAVLFANGLRSRELLHINNAGAAVLEHYISCNSNIDVIVGDGNVPSISFVTFIEEGSYSNNADYANVTPTKKKRTTTKQECGADSIRGYCIDDTLEGLDCCTEEKVVSSAATTTATP